MSYHSGSTQKSEVQDLRGLKGGPGIIQISPFPKRAAVSFTNVKAERFNFLYTFNRGVLSFPMEIKKLSHSLLKKTFLVRFKRPVLFLLKDDGNF